MQLLGDVRRAVLLRDVLYVFSHHAGAFSNSSMCRRQNSLIRVGHSVDRRANLRNDTGADYFRSPDRRILHLVAGQLRIGWRRLLALRQQGDGQVHAAAGAVRKSLLRAVLLPRLVLLHSAESRRHEADAERKWESAHTCRKIH